MNHRVKRRCEVVVSLIAAFALMCPPTTAQSRQRRLKQSSQQGETAKTSQPVAIVNNPVPEYRSGEVSVVVRGNENPIIRLGLAPNGVTLVEFPATDRFFALNPGNTDLVKVEDSPTKETDHFFVIRPGTGFLPAVESKEISSPATSIIVQMNSGMVVTFLLYPVRDIERNAHRCVVTYDREAIIDARRAAGLATNLDKGGEKAVVIQSAMSARIAPSVETVAPPAAIASTQSIANEKEMTSEAPPSKSPIYNTSFPDEKDKWSKRVHGLKIAARCIVVNAQQRQVVVAVHNTLTKPVKIVPGYPELYIQTLDDKGRVLQTESLKRANIDISSSNQVIGPGEMVRYLIWYEAPVLGARQRLGVAVAQINAADEPVTMELTTGTR
jgi:hypothetical protein